MSVTREGRTVAARRCAASPTLAASPGCTSASGSATSAIKSKLTQEQAAVYAGLTRKSIARLENARFPNPHLSTLLRLMTTYNIGSLEELLGTTPSARLAEAWEEKDWEAAQEDRS